MEVMGLMLGSFVDDFTIKVVDVFAMPQVGPRGHIPASLPPRNGRLASGRHLM
jgi:hypothetical protein